MDMADSVTRRRFLGRASKAAVAAGAVAAGGAILGATGSAEAASLAARPGTPVLEGSGVIAHVIDARKGELSIFVGTREIRVTDRALAQQLLRATHAVPPSNAAATSMPGGR